MSILIQEVLHPTWLLISMFILVLSTLLFSSKQGVVEKNDKIRILRFNITKKSERLLIALFLFGITLLAALIGYGFSQIHQFYNRSQSLLVDATFEKLLVILVLFIFIFIIKFGDENEI